MSLGLMDLSKKHGKKPKPEYYDLAEMMWNTHWRYNDIKYSARFEDILKSLRYRLAELEQNLNSINEHPEKQKVVLEILTEIGNTKKEIRRHETNLQCSKNMQAVKSQKIPAIIADHNVWNDCWYDEKMKVYVTHNEYFKGIPNSRTREIQIKYEKECNDDGIVIEENRIKFFFGYPALKLTYKTSGNSVNFLLPTLTDDMITKEIVKARLTPQSNEEAIMYETQSESWLEFGNGLKLTEKEYELGMDLGRYSPIPLYAVKLAAGRI